MLVVVSAVTMCSQKESVAPVVVAGMATVWRMLSVCGVPYPFSHAFHEPVCEASKLELSITPEVTVHGAGFADPFSKPGLPNNCCAPPLVTVKLIVTERVCPPPEPLTTTL